MGSVGVGGPFRIDLVVDRDEGRFAPDSEADVVIDKALVHQFAEFDDLRPSFVGVRLCHPRILVNAGDGVGELEGGFGDPGGPRSAPPRPDSG